MSFVVLGGLLAGVALAIIRIADWGAGHQIIVQRPWDFATKAMVVIKDREIVKPLIITTDDDLLVTDSVDPTVWETIRLSAKPEIAALVVATFPSDSEEMLAIFMAESGLNKDAVGWNCLYEEYGSSVSRACKEGDRVNAWSVDCGVSQLNFKGLTCPLEAFDPVWNITVGAKKKYDSQGKEAWTAYNTGVYLSYR